jgi:hypothetical protein
VVATRVRRADELFLLAVAESRLVADSGEGDEQDIGPPLDAGNSHHLVFVESLDRLLRLCRVDCKLLQTRHSHFPNGSRPRDALFLV